MNDTLNDAIAKLRQQLEARLSGLGNSAGAEQKIAALQQDLKNLTLVI